MLLKFQADPMQAPKPIDEDFLDPAQWMSPRELAGVLGIKVQSLYNKISTGEDMPASYPISDRVTRFYRPEVKAWLLEHRRVPAAVQLEQQAERRASS